MSDVPALALDEHRALSSLVQSRAIALTNLLRALGAEEVGPVSSTMTVAAAHEELDALARVVERLDLDVAFEIRGGVQ